MPSQRITALKLGQPCDSDEQSPKRRAISSADCDLSEAYWKVITITNQATATSCKVMFVWMRMHQKPPHLHHYPQMSWQTPRMVPSVTECPWTVLPSHHRKFAMAWWATNSLWAPLEVRKKPYPGFEWALTSPFPPFRSLTLIWGLWDDLQQYPESFGLIQQQHLDFESEQMQSPYFYRR